MAPGKKISSRSFYQKLIRKSFNDKRTILKGKLQNSSWVCTTADCWSSRRKSFLGVTAHWFENMKRKSACLAISCLPSKKEPHSLSEVDIYLSDASNQLENLDNYPTIKKVFIKYNTSLPASAAGERLFSVAGLIFTTTHSRLSDKNLEQLIFLRANANV